MKLNMRFPLSKNCQTTPKLLTHVFYIMYHKNYYQVNGKVHFLIVQHPLLSKIKRLSVQVFSYLFYFPTTCHDGICHDIIYRVSHNSVFPLVFLISRLPIGVKIPPWTYFNSPFCVDFKNIYFFIIW